jgi:hypothetical protein
LNWNLQVVLTLLARRPVRFERQEATMVQAVLDQLTALPARQRLLADLAFAGVLIALVWAAYTPSQKHAPRADQWCFIVDTMKFRGVAATVAGSYSYNRTRTLSPGDTDLFRPVLFALLATEQWLVAGDLWVYQTIGIILHVTICFLLLALLRQLATLVPRVEAEAEVERATETGWPRTAGDYVPYALTAFFALNPAVQELVIWAHLHGYLLFLALLFGSLNLLFRALAQPTFGSLWSGNLIGAWVLAFVSAFTYEMGQFYAVFAGLFSAVAAYPRTGLLRSLTLFVLFASILPTYQAINRYDYELHRGQYIPDNAPRAIYDQLFTHATITHSVRFGLYTAIQPFCPSMLETAFSGGRLQIAETLWNETSWRKCGPTALVSALVLVLTMSFTAAGLYGFCWRGQRLPILILLLLAALYAFYAAMTVLGRMNLRPGPAMLTSNCYYTYTAFVLLIPLLFAAWQGILGAGSRVAAVGRSALVGGLVILSFVGAEHIRRVNLEVAQTPLMRDITRPAHAVNLFVKAHYHEPDFSIAIDYESSDTVPKYGYYTRAVDAIFHRWLAEEPKYRIAIREGKCVLLTGRPASQPIAAERGSTTQAGVGRTSRRVGGLAARLGSSTYDACE